MCGCKGRKNNGSARIFARNAQIQEPTQELQFNGTGASLIFVGQSTKVRYEVTTGDTVDVYDSDVKAFLKYVQKGNKLFSVITPEYSYGVDESNGEDDVTFITVLSGDLIIEDESNEQLLQEIMDNQVYEEVIKEPVTEFQEQETEEIIEIVVEEIVETPKKRKSKATE